MARRNAVYDRAINTADRTVFEHDFALRYLAPYRDQLKAAARQVDLDEAWVNGLIRQESRFIAQAKSRVGAGGLMQLMPATAKWVAGKIGARPTIVIGMLINMVSLWQMGHFDLAMTSRMVEVSGFLQGFGSALMFNPIGVISYSTLPPQHRNEAAVLSNMMRSVAGSFGIAFYTAFELRHTATVRGHMVSHISEVDAVVNWRLPDVLGEPGPALAMLSGEVDRQSAMIGLNTAYGYMFISTLAMLPLLFFLRPGKGVAAGPVMADAH